MRVYRICKKIYRASAYTGAGARLYPGRWNEPDVPMVYTAASESLALLELLIHLQPHAIQTMTSEYEVLAADIDAGVPILSIQPPDLPPSWDSHPPGPLTRQMGSRWITSLSSAVLEVPSVVVPTELNYLINPHHLDCKRIRLVPGYPVSLDPRLLKLLVP